MKKKNNFKNENEVKIRLKKLRQLILKNNILYHQKDNPKISDNQYDKYVKENNIRLILLPRTKNISTSIIKDRVSSSKKLG